MTPILQKHVPLFGVFFDGGGDTITPSTPLPHYVSYKLLLLLMPRWNHQNMYLSGPFNPALRPRRCQVVKKKKKN